jgi:hypothetical protein
MVSDGIVVLKNIDEYREYCKKYNCKNLRELDDLLWYNYGVSLEINNHLKNVINFNENNL